MQEITMLISYLLTTFHSFSVYLISRTWCTIWDFLRNLKGKLINIHVTKGVHRLGRPHRTKPWLGGPRKWPTNPTLAGRPHLVHMHAGMRQREHRHHKVSLAKIHGRPATWWPPDRPFVRKCCGQSWEPSLGDYKCTLCSTLRYIHCTTCYPFVKALVLY
jgi:hypothetical protein